MMLQMMVQVVIIGIWTAMLGVHTRRLLRLTHVAPLYSDRNKYVRQRLSRAWWWLGREEFWRNVQTDTVRCLQLTFMLFIAAWAMA